MPATVVNVNLYEMGMLFMDRLKPLINFIFAVAFDVIVWLQMTDVRVRYVLTMLSPV